MSKLPWKPEGGRPPRLIIEGVDPRSPEAAEVARAFAPQIKRFYLGAAQNHALGVVPQSRSQRQFGDDLYMQYTNQSGQETVRVRARGGSSKVTTSSVRRPDWALVNFTIPTDFVMPVLGSGTWKPVTMEFYARYNGNVDGDPYTVAYQLPFVAHTLPRELTFAGDGTGADHVDVDYVPGTFTASLLIDLRGQRGTVVIDIFAIAERATYEQTGWVTSFSHATTEDYTPWDDTFGPFPGFNEAEALFLAQGYPLEYQRLFNAVTDIEVTGTGGSSLTSVSLWAMPFPPYIRQSGPPESSVPYRYFNFVQDPATGLVTQNISTAVAYGNPPANTIATTGPITTNHFDINPTYGYVYRIDPALCDVRGSLYYGTPPWDIRLRDRNPNPFFTELSWEYVWQIDGESPGLGMLAEDAPLPVPREFRTDHYGIGLDPQRINPPDEGTLFGKIFCDLERNALSFAPVTQP